MRSVKRRGDPEEIPGRQKRGQQHEHGKPRHEQGQSQAAASRDVALDAANLAGADGLGILGRGGGAGTRKRPVRHLAGGAGRGGLCPGGRGADDFEQPRLAERVDPLAPQRPHGIVIRCRLDPVSGGKPARHPQLPAAEPLGADRRDLGGAVGGRLAVPRRAPGRCGRRQAVLGFIG